MKKTIPTALLSMLLVLAFAGAAVAQTADATVEKYLAALGGRAALGKLTSRKATGTISVATQGAELSGPLEIYSKPPNKTRAAFRLDLAAAGASGEMVMEQIFDGKTGFSLNSMQGDSEITGRQLESMRNNVFPSPLLTYKESGVKIEALPAEVVNGQDTVVVRVTPKTGAPSKLFFDAKTFLMVRTKTTIDSPLGGNLEQTTDLSDYRVVDGVKVAFQLINTNELQTVTIKLAKVEHNVPIDDAMFVKK